MKEDYPLCSLKMKLPPLASAPLDHPPGEPSAALRRAAEAWPESGRSSQLQTILRAAGLIPPRFVLAATSPNVEPSDLPLAAVLAECLPGRSAVVMAPQIEATLAEQTRHELAVELLRALEQILQVAGVLLAQGLTANREDPASAWFQAAGYRDAGDLLYLSADLSETLLQPVRPPLFGPLELLAHPLSDFDRWVPLVEQTYLHTLDCPAVDGLRPTRDVLIGYRDIGQPRDDWSFIVQHAGRDVGCLIIADHRETAHAELVYMGLIPETRGRGWGVFLAQEAQRIAAAAGASHLVLSVDAANRPALRHYQSAGFRFWEQRTIWIKGL